MSTSNTEEPHGDNLRVAHTDTLKGVLSGRRADVAALAIILVTVLAGLAPAILRPDLVFVGHDVDQNYNWEMNTRFALANHQFPFWNPYLLSGVPSFADFQTGVSYPPSALMRWLPVSQFLTWNTALHLWLAGAGTFALCRVLGTSRFAATLAAVGFGLGGVLTSRILAGHLHFLYAIAWIPLAITCAFQGSRAVGWLPYPALAVVLAIQYLAGYTQIFVYTVVATAFVTLACVTGPARELPRHAAQAASRIVLTVALMIALSAGQLISSLRLLPEMGRYSGIEYSAATRYSFQTRDLLATFFPRAFADPSREFHEETGDILWEKVSYVGLALPLLAPIGLVWSGHRNVVVLGTLAIAALLLAFGNNLPFYQLHHVFFSGFRYPGRLLVFWSLGIAVLGAVGLDVLCAWVRAPATRRRGWVVVGLATAGALGAFIYGWGIRPGPDYSRLLGSSVWIAIGTVISIVAIPIIARRTRLPWAPAALLGVVLVCDLAVFTERFVVVGEPPRQEAIAAALYGDDVGRVISACEEGFSPYRNMNVLVPLVDGHNTAFLEDYARFAYLTRGERVPATIRQFPTFWLDTPKRLDLLDLLNVTHVVNCTPLNIDRFRLLDRVNGLYLYRNPQAMPRAWWACDFDLVGSDDEAIQLLGDRLRDARRKPVILNPGPGQIGNLQECQSSTTVNVMQRDTASADLMVDVDGVGGGLLVLSETHYPDRSIWVDSTPAPMLIANLAFSAVFVPSGQHRVELRYVPNALYLGSSISAIGIVLALLLERFRRRAVGATPASTRERGLRGDD